MVIELLAVGAGLVATVIALVLQAGWRTQEHGKDDGTRHDLKIRGIGKKGPDAWLCKNNCIPCKRGDHDYCESMHCDCREGDYYNG